MEIKKIKLCNFGPYLGEQVIDVNNNNNKIIIIKGENGSGKTTLLNALIWCLYGDIEKNLHEIITDKILFELEDNSESLMFVEIQFLYNNFMHIIKRTVKINKKSNNINISEPIVTLEKFTDNAETETYDYQPYIYNYINSIINESVKNYFFFDGSRIESFTKEKYENDVKVAIKNILRIEAINRAIEHIKNLIVDYQKEIKDLDASNEIIKLNDELDKNKIVYNQIREKIKNLENEKNNCIDNIENINREINSFEKNSIYYEEIDKINKEIKIKEKDIIDNYEKLKNFLGKNSILLFTDELINDSIRFLEDKNKRPDIPARFLKEILKKSIEQKKCVICDSEIDNYKINELSKNKLVELCIDDNENTDNSNILSEIKILKEKRKNIYDYFLHIVNNINSLEKELDELYNKKKMINDKIGSLDPEHYKKLKIQLSEFDKIKEEIIKNEAIEKNNLENINKKISEIETKINNLQLKDNKAKFIQNKLNIAYKIKEELEHIFNNYEKEEIQNINKEFFNIFHSIIRKEKVYTNIYVNDDYKIFVKREYTSENIINQLSYGERQILSLSLILALAKVSGDRGPFIMDTPMGNLDPLHREKLIINIPKLVNQLFLFVTSSEFTNDLMKICLNDINVIYKLHQNKEGYTTILKEGE